MDGLEGYRVYLRIVSRNLQTSKLAITLHYVQADWDDEFLRLDGPEVYRMSLSGMSVDACRHWIQNSWSERWVKPGNGLTTPVKLVLTRLGIQV